VGTPRQLEHPGTPYESDLVAWASEQAALLRAGMLSALDAVHIAEELEDLGESEKRALRSHLAVLMAHLLKWQHQPALRCTSWRRTVAAERKEVLFSLQETPSLRTVLGSTEWIDLVWARALSLAAGETGLDCFPDPCPWDLDEQVLGEWWPE